MCIRDRIMSSWLDRPLSISGRIVTAKNGKVETKLVNIDRNLLVIPSLAIHMSRDINTVSYTHLNMKPYAEVKQIEK